MASTAKTAGEKGAAGATSTSTSASAGAGAGAGAGAAAALIAAAEASMPAAASAPFDMTGVDDEMGCRYELQYFNKRGRAERIRLLLTLAAEPFRDQVVSGKQWGSYKKELALGTLPALFDDATCEETGQSMAIMRMMARKKDLYGSTARQQTVADIVADTVEDYRSKAARALFGPQGPDSEALMRYFEQDWPKLAAILTKFQRGAGGYFVEAGKPTYADVCVWDLFDAILQLRPEALADHSSLKSFHTKFAAIPRIKAYLAKRRPVDSEIANFPTARPVLVTGASGYVASQLIAQLLQRGYHVRGTVRDVKKEAKVAHLRALAHADTNLELVQANLLTSGSFDAAAKGCAIVFHTASPFFPSHEAKDPMKELIDPAVQGTLNVLQACSKAKVRRVILTSSAAAVYFANKAKSHVWSEEDWTDVEYAREKKNWYVISKALAEKAAWEFAQGMGKKCPFTLVSMNPTLVIGPMIQPGLNTSSKILRTMAQTGGPDTRCVVDVRDVARAHILAAENPKASGRYLLISACFAKATYQKMFWKGLPKEAQPVVAEEAAGDPNAFSSTIYFSCDKAMQELGLTFTPVAKSVADTAASLHARGYLEESE